MLTYARRYEAVSDGYLTNPYGTFPTPSYGAFPTQSYGGYVAEPYTPAVEYGKACELRSRLIRRSVHACLLSTVIHNAYF
jgi:hypothetical protein